MRRARRTLRRLRSRLPVAPWILAGAVTFGLALWGLTRLSFEFHKRSGAHLDIFQSLYASVKLFLLDLGPAASSTARPNWQLGLAAVLAGALTIRAILGLLGRRMRQWFIAHRLRDHVIICGAGTLGNALARSLDATHDVVLIDLASDPAAGHPDPTECLVWTLQGDATLMQTLRRAGIARATELIAVTGDDDANSLIVTVVHELDARRELRRRMRVHVRVEKPALLRFFEEPPDASAAQLGPIVSPFSTNAVAARALLRDNDSLTPPADGRDGDEGLARLGVFGGSATHLLLAGDHPLLEAIMLEALRRWRAAALRLPLVTRDPSSSGSTQPASEAPLPPLRISYFGEDAEDRVEEMRRRWTPEPHLLEMEGRDLAAIGAAAEESEDWLRKLRTDAPVGNLFAIVACGEELAATELALSLGRTLGADVPLTRVALHTKSTLDQRIERRTGESRNRSTVVVKPLVDLVSATVRQSTPEERLTRLLQGRVDDPAEKVSSLMARRDQLGLHTASVWHFSEREAPMLRALAERDGLPLDALVAAGLAIDLYTEANLLDAGVILAETASDTTSPAWWGAFAACCEYVRLLRASDRDIATALPHAFERLAKVADGDCLRVLELFAVAHLPEPSRSAALAGRADPLADAQPRVLRRRKQVAIFAGGADSMTRRTMMALSMLLGCGEAQHGTPDAENGGGAPLLAALQQVLDAVGGEDSSDARGLRRFSEGLQAVTRSLAAPVPSATREPGALFRYRGIVLTGGTASGICKVVAEAADRNDVPRIGYVPRGKADLALYPDPREVASDTFGVKEPLAMWADILAAGIQPDHVCLVACPGGEITLAEILLARALGANVSWLDPHRDAPIPLRDDLPGGNEGIVELPADSMCIRAMISRSVLRPDDLREKLARYAHNQYRARQLAHKPAGDAALAAWEWLLPALRESNLAQVDDIPNKLASIGLELEKDGDELTLTDAEVHLLAMMEHGRYVVERLTAGWRPGDREAARKSSPYLLPWRDLDDDTKRWDEDVVLSIGPAIKEFAYGVRPLVDEAARVTEGNATGKGPTVGSAGGG